MSNETDHDPLNMILSTHFKILSFQNPQLNMTYSFIEKFDKPQLLYSIAQRTENDTNENRPKTTDKRWHTDTVWLHRAETSRGLVACPVSAPLRRRFVLHTTRIGIVPYSEARSSDPDDNSRKLFTDGAEVSHCARINPSTRLLQPMSSPLIHFPSFSVAYTVHRTLFDVHTLNVQRTPNMLFCTYAFICARISKQHHIQDAVVNANNQICLIFPTIPSATVYTYSDKQCVTRSLLHCSSSTRSSSFFNTTLTVARKQMHQYSQHLKHK